MRVLKTSISAGENSYPKFSIQPRRAPRGEYEQTVVRKVPVPQLVELQESFVRCVFVLDLQGLSKQRRKSAVGSWFGGAAAVCAIRQTVAAAVFISY